MAHRGRLPSRRPCWQSLPLLWGVTLKPALLLAVAEVNSDLRVLEAAASIPNHLSAGDGAGHVMWAPKDRDLQRCTTRAKITREFPHNPPRSFFPTWLCRRISVKNKKHHALLDTEALGLVAASQNGPGSSWRVGMTHRRPPPPSGRQWCTWNRCRTPASGGPGGETAGCKGPRQSTVDLGSKNLLTLGLGSFCPGKDLWAPSSSHPALGALASLERPTLSAGPLAETSPHQSKSVCWEAGCTMTNSTYATVTLHCHQSPLNVEILLHLRPPALKQGTGSITMKTPQRGNLSYLLVVIRSFNSGGHLWHLPGEASLEPAGGPRGPCLFLQMMPPCQLQPC